MQSPVVGPLDLSKLAVVAPHVPLIRFRKGLELQQQEEHQRAAVASPAGTSLQQSFAVAPAAASASPSGGVLEWWQRPEKFARKPLDDQEIEVINGGGADVVFQ